MDIELKTSIVFSVIFIIACILANLINLAFKKINKYFNDKRLTDFDNFVSANNPDYKTTNEQLAEELKLKYDVKDDFNFDCFPNFPNTQQFYNIIKKRDDTTKRQKRIANSQKKHNHKTASNSRKMRARANG